MRTEILEALARFVAQRSGIDSRNYGGSREAFMGDYRRILRDGREARALLRVVELNTGHRSVGLFVGDSVEASIPPANFFLMES